MNHFTANHIRSIRSLVLVTDQHLQSIEQLLVYASVMKLSNRQLTIVNNLDQQQFDQIFHTIAEIKSVIQGFTQAYAIDPEEESLKKMVNAKALGLWEDVSGADFDKLIGYGEIYESDRKEYESFTGPLYQLTKHLIKITNP